MIFRSYMFLVSLLFFCGTLQPRTIFISHDTGPAARGGEGAEAGVGTDSSGKRRRTAEAAEFVGTTLVVWNDRITDHSVFEITTDHVRTCAIGDALKLIFPTDEHPALKDLLARLSPSVSSAITWQAVPLCAIYMRVQTRHAFPGMNS